MFGPSFKKYVNVSLVRLNSEPQSKKFCTESSNDSSVDAVSTCKVWECFTEILHDCGATTDTEGRKKVIVN